MIDLLPKTILTVVVAFVLALSQPFAVADVEPTATGTVAEQSGDSSGSDSPGEKKPFFKRLFSRSSKSEESDEAKAAQKKEKEQKKLERQAGVGSSSHALAKVQDRLRRGPLRRDPQVRAYMDLVDRNAASPAQLNSFGNLLADRGFFADAIEYHREAVRLDKNDGRLWGNLGTIQRQMGQLSAAVASYRKAVALDPNDAKAHYNLGATYDALNDYDKAVEEYLTALTIDPSLGDPDVNPQVVNNERMTAVRLILYDRQTGALGLPLEDVPGGEPPAEKR